MVLQLCVSDVIVFLEENNDFRVALISEAKNVNFRNVWGEKSMFLSNVRWPARARELCLDQGYQPPVR